MKTFIDHQILKRIAFEKINPPLQTLELEWSSLLVCLSLENLVASFPLFEENNSLFQSTTSILETELKKNDICEIYDYLFAEHLSFIKNCKEIKIDFLLNAIDAFLKSENKLLIESLLQEIMRFRKYIEEHPADALHDLILYLAWDRMCVNCGRLFDRQSKNQNYNCAVQVFKECLVESFQHIFMDKKTVPSFFRLVHSLFYYYMREENLKNYTEEEWLLLCLFAQSLESDKKLSDAFYIDKALIPKECDSEIPFLNFASVKNEKSMSVHCALAHFVLSKELDSDQFNCVLGNVNYNTIDES